MHKRIFFLLATLFLTTTGALAETSPQPETPPPPQISFKRAAVAPFLMGRRQPNMDETMDLTLSCPIGEICDFDPTIAANAGITLTRLVNDHLHTRFGSQLVGQDEVSRASAQLRLNNEQDTPRSMARKLADILDVDAVFVGMVWRYRDRGALEGIPDSPASVAFAVYLIEARTGRQLWRGIYSGTQQTVMQNLFEAKKQLKMGFKWLSADELAGHGVQEAFREFAPHEETAE